MEVKVGRHLEVVLHLLRSSKPREDREDRLFSNNSNNNNSSRYLIELDNSRGRCSKGRFKDKVTFKGSNRYKAINPYVDPHRYIGVTGR
jgi:hypothetical protein